MLATYLALAVLLVMAVAVGHALTPAARPRAWRWPAPAVGLAALVCLSSTAIRLPGRAVTAAVVTALAATLAAAWLWRTRGIARALDALPAGTLAVLAASVPFLASGRVGLLGISLNNDTSVHLVWAESLAAAGMEALYPLPAGYPLGPHAVMGALSRGLGVPMDAALVALLVAAAVCGAWAAACALDGLAALPRAGAAVLVPFAYLAAAWFGQGAFKELLHATFLLAFVVLLHELIRRDSAARARDAIPLGLLAAASVSTYSYLALAWYVTTLGALAVLLVASGRVPARPRALACVARLALPAAGAGVLAFLVGVAPELPRTAAYFGALGLSPASTGGLAASDLGNLVGPLSPWSTFGLWPTADFRFLPANVFRAGQLGALGLLATAFALLWWIRRRDVAVPAAVIGATVVFAVSRTTGQSPYVTAKALVIAAPLVMLLALRPLLARPDWRAARDATLARLALGMAFVIVATWSTALVLRAAPVAASAQADQLATLRPLLRSGQTLFLGNDDFVGWRLRGIRLGYVQTTAYPPPLTAPLRAEKPFVYGQPLDFDSVASEVLNRFRYVVTVRSGFDSIPPPNFRRIRTTPLYEAWERSGPTQPRQTLEGSDAPVARFDCRSAPGAALRRQAGTATVWPAPVASAALPAVRPGGSVTLVLDVPRGRWTLSMRYTSPQPVAVTASGQRWTLPANLDRPGPYWRLGTMRSEGGRPTTFSVRVGEGGLVRQTASVTSIPAIVAVREDAARQVPLAAACGAYVDSYRLAGTG